MAEIPINDPRIDSIAKQHEILERAHAIFFERSAVRGDHWATNPITTHVTSIEQKLGRIKFGLIPGDHPTSPAKEGMIDDALDIINYAAFIVRKLTGEYPHG